MSLQCEYLRIDLYSVRNVCSCKIVNEDTSIYTITAYYICVSNHVSTAVCYYQCSM